jgi:hypothetical protein
LDLKVWTFKASLTEPPKLEGEVHTDRERSDPVGIAAGDKSGKIRKDIHSLQRIIYAYSSAQVVVAQQAIELIERFLRREVAGWRKRGRRG